MRMFVDTNILLYAVNTDAAEHAAARRFLERLEEDGTPWCSSWPVVYEFLRVSTHARVFPRPLKPVEALDFITVLLASPGLTVLTPTGRHARLLLQTVSELALPAGNLFHDIATAVLMREHGVVRIASADTDFLLFTFLQVEDPAH